MCFFLCFLCFFLCTPWPWAPARLNSSASPAEGEPVNGVRQEWGRESPEEPSFPRGSHSSRGTRCYHSNSPAFPPSHLWRSTLKAPRSEKGPPFLQRPKRLYRPALTWLRGLHSPRGAPASPQLTHGFLRGKGAGNDQEEADMPLPPRGRTNSSKTTGTSGA